MNHRHFAIGVLMLAIIGFVFSPAHGGEQSRMLINIKPQQTSQKDMSTAQISGDDTSGILVALFSKQLLNNGYQVLTFDEVVPSHWISEKDIRQANQGHIGKLRKIGAIKKPVISSTGRFVPVYLIRK